MFNLISGHLIKLNTQGVLATDIIYFVEIGILNFYVDFEIQIT